MLSRPASGNGMSAARLDRAAVIAQPHGTGVHAALLLYTRGVECTVDLGGEFPVTEESRLATALRFGAAELELPYIAGAVGYLLCTT